MAKPTHIDMAKTPQESRLDELIDTLHSGQQLTEDEMAELEAMLSADHEARAHYILRQELHTMLEVDKSVRLQLAIDELPDHILTDDFADEQVPESDDTPAPAPKLSRSSKEAFRMATSIAAMIAGVIGMLWMYVQVEKFTQIEAANEAAKKKAAESEVAAEDEPEKPGTDLKEMKFDMVDIFKGTTKLIGL